MDSSISSAKCRGLIEADYLRAVISRSFRRFPRRNAEASLKQGDQNSPEAQAAGFPRRNAEASLKLFQRAPFDVRDFMISSAKCRGLIEATLLSLHLLALI